jgi:hypothetical protein
MQVKPTLVMLAAGLVVALALGVSAAPSSAQKPAAKKATPKAKTTEDMPPIWYKLLLFPEADPDNGPAPLTVNFTVTIYDDDVVKPKFTWNFGDGSRESHQQNVQHTYKKPGQYKATIRVTDANDRLGTDVLQIDVDEPGS